MGVGLNDSYYNKFVIYFIDMFLCKIILEFFLGIFFLIIYEFIKNFLYVRVVFYF